MKILGCFAHLDDAEIWAGGTLIKHFIAGDQIFTIAFSESSDIRIKESQTAHDSLKATLIIFSDSLQDREVIIEKLIKLFIEIKPDIILSHWSNDCHPDHRKVYEFCSFAIIKSWIATSFPKAFYSVDTYNSQGISSVFMPTHYLDISDVWDEKIKLINNFKSQPIRVWTEMCSLQNRMYGSRVNRLFAEGFIQIPIQGKLTSVNYLKGE